MNNAPFSSFPRLEFAETRAAVTDGTRHPGQTRQRVTGRGIPKYLLLLALLVTAETAKADGDPKRGGQAFRACVACHALEPGLHLSGPSLGDFLQRKAGMAAGYSRYSTAIKSAGFEWTPSALDAWIENPEKMVPGTYMSFRGIANAAVRADLVAFLLVAGTAGGSARAVAEGLIPGPWIRSVAPDPIGDAPPESQVSAVRHCGDSYFITTRDNIERPFWEKNVRLKIDSTQSGPPSGTPVIIGAGMQGDRVSVIFKNVADLSRLVTEGCR